MADRRRSPRVVVSGPLPARVRTIHEAVVERVDGVRAEVITAHPAARGHTFTLQFTSPSGELTVHTAYVLSSTPVAQHDALAWRLVLSISPVAGDERDDLAVSLLSF